MNSKNLGRLFARYTFPTVLAMLVSSTYQIADGIIVGHFIGPDALAAVSLIWPWFSIPSGFGLLIGVGIGTISSIARGAGDIARADRCIGQLFAWLLIPGVIIGAPLYLFAPTLVSWQGATGLSAEYTIDYLRVIAASCPIVIASMALPFLVRNLDAPRLATLFMIIGAILNLVLAYVFTVYLHWSVWGVALATVIGEAVVSVLGLAYIFSARCPVRLQRSDCLPDWPLTKNIALNGASSLFMYIYLGAIGLMHHILLLKYGNSEWVAAYAIAGYALTIYYLIAEGVASGMQPIVSHLHGANQRVAVKRIFNMALWWGVGSGIVFTLLLQLSPQFFVSIFTDDMDTLNEKSIYAVRIHLFAMFLDGLFVIAAAFLQSLNQGRLALYITVGNMLVQVPFLLFMPLWIDIHGVWLAMPISNIALMIYVIWLLRRQLKDYQSVTELPATPITHH